MTVSADALYLPMLNPVRTPVRAHNPTRHPPRHPQDITHDQPHRVYRMKPRERHDGIAYGPGGYASPRQPTGRNVDIYA